MFKFVKINPNTVEQLEERVQLLESKIYYLQNKERLSKIMKEYKELVAPNSSVYYNFSTENILITDNWYDYQYISEADMISKLNEVKVELCEKRKRGKKSNVRK